MTDDIENLVLVQLREMRDENTTRFDRIEHQIAALHVDVGWLHADIAGIHLRLDHVEASLDRIERRLDQDSKAIMSDDVSQELPVVAWRARHISEPGMIGYYPWSFQDREKVAKAPGYEYEPLASHADAQAIIADLRAEIDRLTGALKKANDQAEHFEREWYLRGDELDALRAAAGDAKK